MTLKKFLLYYHSMKFMRYEQILWRIFFVVKRLVYKKAKSFFCVLYSIKAANVKINDEYESFSGEVDLRSEKLGMEGAVRDDLNNLREKLKPLVERNEFSFLNKSVCFKKSINWQDSEVERLWLYNLHYFDYAFDLGLAHVFEKGNLFFNTFRRLTEDWILKNSHIGCGPGWEPYPVSLRIVNWIYAYSFFKDNIRKDEDFEEKFKDSLAAQCEFLSKNIEFHVSRNHLLKNGKALFLAGMFFQNAEGKRKNLYLRWKAKGETILLNGLHIQILGDGGHYERCPMYHLIVLQDYLEVFLLAQRNNVSCSIEKKLKKMALFLINILHPDNDMPLFNDSAFGIAKKPGELIEIAASCLNGLKNADKFFEPTLYTKLLAGSVARECEDVEPEIIQQETQQFEDSGFCAIRDKKRDHFFIINYKEPSPFRQPGHSHSDMLSYELSLGSKRFIVDSGAYNYSKGKWREYFRGTAAHNTVVINGHDQSELWGIFGVARRARLLYSRFRIINGKSSFFEAGLKGFPPFYNLSHHRMVFYIDNLFWIVFDLINGDGVVNKSYKIQNIIHAHPDREVEIGGVKHEHSCNDLDHHANIAIKDENAVLQVAPLKISSEKGVKSEITLKKVNDGAGQIQGWYSSGFGEKRGNIAIVIEKETCLPAAIGYALFPSTSGFSDFSAGCEINSSFDSGIKNMKLNFEIKTSEYSYRIKKYREDIEIDKF